MSVESLLTFLFRLHRPTIEYDENGYKEKYNRKNKNVAQFEQQQQLAVVGEMEKGERRQQRIVRNRIERARERGSGRKERERKNWINHHKNSLVNFFQHSKHANRLNGVDALAHRTAKIKYCHFPN